MSLFLNRKYNLNKLYLFTFIFLVPIFDSFTGFLVRGESFSAGGLGTPSQFISFFIVILSILIIKSRKVYRIILLIILYLCLVEFLVFMFHQSFQGLLMGVVFSYKFIFPVFVFFALKKIFKNLNYTEYNIINLVYKISSVIAITFLIGNFIAIKVGIASSFFRSSGLFSSGNGLGVLLGAFSLIILYGLDKKYLKKYKHKYIYCLILSCLLLISTKASAIFLAINLLVLLLRLSLSYKIIIYSSLTILLISFYKAIIEFLNISFELVIWRFNNKSSWTNFLLSSRSDFITNAMSSFNETKYIYFRSIFGAGSFLSYESPTKFTLLYKMMEMDSFDTFFMYGLIGIMVYIIVMYYCIINTLRKSKVLTLATIAIFFHSIFAGHTMYDGLAVMAVVFIFLLIKDNKPQNDFSKSLNPT